MGNVSSGSAISVAQAIEFAQNAGFSTSKRVGKTPYNQVQLIVAIAHAESGLRADAINNTHDQWNSQDQGIMQINNHWHPEVGPICAFQPLCAFKAAYTISSSGTDFTPWCTAWSDGACGHHGGSYLGIGSPFLNFIEVGAGGTPNQTIAEVFDSKHLWKWWTQNHGLGTNLFNGTTEKGMDYSNTFGTPIGVPYGGVIQRIQHNNNSIGDVVELLAANGSVWLYQHITAKVKVGQALGVGAVIGTENGLPRDQYSTGPHIEVRYCKPGTWKPSIDNWNEPWINPLFIFSNLSNQTAEGTVDPTPPPGGPGGPGLSGLPSIKLAPNANVAQLLVAIDDVGAIINPLDTTGDNVQSISILGATFDNPFSWLEAVGTNIFDDVRAIFFRALLIIIGSIIMYKVISKFVDVGAFVGAAAKIGETAALL